MEHLGHVLCAVAPDVARRLKVDVQARRVVLPSDVWSDAVEAAIRAVDSGDDLAARHREVIAAAIAEDAASGPGRMAEDLTELLSLVEARRLGKQLLAVPCPTCGAAAGACCEERPGKVLLLSRYHAERFWAAVGSRDG